jgi:hypothetical protein
VLIILSVTITALYTGLVESLHMKGVSAAEADDFRWIAENTPVDAQFVVLSSSKNWQYDHTAEWFPVIAGRRSIDTVQGSEWQPAGSYDRVIANYASLKQCYFTGPGCVTDWLSSTQQTADYILVTKSPCSDSLPYCSAGLLTALQEEQRFVLVRDTEASALFRVGDAK